MAATSLLSAVFNGFFLVVQVSLILLESKFVKTESGEPLFFGQSHWKSTIFEIMLTYLSHTLVSYSSPSRTVSVWLEIFANPQHDLLH